MIFQILTEQDVVRENPDHPINTGVDGDAALEEAIGSVYLAILDDQVKGQMLITNPSSLNEHINFTHRTRRRIL